jgi:hypothetical protein
LINFLSMKSLLMKIDDAVFKAFALYHVYIYIVFHGSTFVCILAGMNIKWCFLCAPHNHELRSTKYPCWLDDRRCIHGENGKIKHFGTITVFFPASVLLFIVFYLRRKGKIQHWNIFEFMMSNRAYASTIENDEFSVSS